MASTDIEICNLALHRIGAASISTLADNTAEARACTRFYARTLKSLLAMYDWPFAERVRPLPSIGVNLLLHGEDLTVDGLYAGELTAYDKYTLAAVTPETDATTQEFGDASIRVTASEPVVLTPSSRGPLNLVGDFSIETFLNPASSDSGSANRNTSIWRVVQDANNYLELTAQVDLTSPGGLDYDMALNLVVGGATVATITETTAMLDGFTWSYLQVVCRRKTLYLYLDGALISSAAIPAGTDMPYGQTILLGGGDTTVEAGGIHTSYLFLDEFKVTHGPAVLGVVPTAANTNPEFAELGDGWAFEYVKPDDAVRLTGVGAEGDAKHLSPEAPFDFKGKTLRTDISEVFARYVSDVTNVLDFPVDFEEALVYKLAIDLAMTLTGAAANESAMAERFQIAYSNALANHSDVPTQVSLDSDFISVRS